jgi:hypothetical protein
VQNHCYLQRLENLFGGGSNDAQSSAAGVHP